MVGIDEAGQAQAHGKTMQGSVPHWLVRANGSVVRCQDRTEQAVGARDLFLMLLQRSDLAVIVSTAAQVAVVFAGEVDRQGRQARRMMSSHHPGRHVRAAGAQVGNAGVNMIPIELCVALLAKRRLNLRIELAEVVKRRGVHGSVPDCFASRHVPVKAQHRIRAPARPGDHALACGCAGDVSAIGLRL
jgi:hypothetical protein